MDAMLPAVSRVALVSRQCQEDPVPQTDQRLNPYAHLVGERDPLQVLESTPNRLDELTRALDTAQLVRRPALEKWSIRDILCHLADTEIAFGFRLRQTASQEHHVIQPFDQDAWAEPSAWLDAHDGLRAFGEGRRWNLLFARAVDPSVMERPVTHPERGTMTFRTILETMAGHDVNHLKQVEGLAGGEVRPT
jgi:hypothetical protein